MWAFGCFSFFFLLILWNCSFVGTSTSQTIDEIVYARSWKKNSVSVVSIFSCCFCCFRFFFFGVWHVALAHAAFFYFELSMHVLICAFNENDYLIIYIPTMRCFYLDYSSFSCHTMVYYIFLEVFCCRITSSRMFIYFLFVVPLFLSLWNQLLCVWLFFILVKPIYICFL